MVNIIKEEIPIEETKKKRIELYVSLLKLHQPLLMVILEKLIRPT